MNLAMSNGTTPQTLSTLVLLANRLRWREIKTRKGRSRTPGLDLWWRRVVLRERFVGVGGLLLVCEYLGPSQWIARGGREDFKR
jgi:hypothetical protein